MSLDCTAPSIRSVSFACLLLLLWSLPQLSIGQSLHEGETPFCEHIASKNGVITGTLSTTGEADELIRAAYQEAFGLDVPYPAYVLRPSYGRDADLSPDNEELWTSTAYIENQLYRVYVHPSGAFAATQRQLRLRPHGRFRTVNMLVDHGTTNLPDIVDTHWATAQEQINQAHAAFAEEQGLAEPIVSFSHTNILVDASALTPNNPQSVVAFLERQGFASDDYDLIGVVDLDAQNQRGGFAFFGGNFAYIGWFFRPEDFGVLSADSALTVANALYGHEVGHVVGWEHEWGGRWDDLRRFWADPALFGWTDVDGDGVIEINDATPYGIGDVSARIPLRSPKDGADSILPNTELAWKPPQAGGPPYHLQLATDRSFSDVVLDARDVSNTEYRVEGLDTETTYYWRVQATEGTGLGPWSLIRSFTTVPEGVSLILRQAPADGAVHQPRDVLLTWAFSNDPSWYHVQVSTNPVLESVVGRRADHLEWIPHTDAFRINYNKQNLYWRVRAQNAAGWGPWSEVFRFTTMEPGFAETELTAPENGSLQSPESVSLTWNAFLRFPQDQEEGTPPEHYHVQLAHDMDFEDRIYDDSTLTEPSKTMEALPSPGPLYWRVRAKNNKGFGPWSRVFHFTTLAPPAAVTLIAPENDAVNQSSTVTFSWEAPANATQYHFQLATDSNFTRLTHEDEAHPGTELSLGPLSYSTTHYWRVRAQNAAGVGPWSEVRGFTIAVSTDAERADETIPDTYALRQNYPNPFNPSTTIAFDLPAPGPVTLVVYDLTGRRVTTLVSARLGAGRYQIPWDASDLASGMYYYHLKAGAYEQTRPMVLLK